MILCPNCQFHEMTGAVFCSQCGSQLLGTDDLFPQSIYTDEVDRRAIQMKAAVSTPPDVYKMNIWVSLRILESGQILPLADRSEFTLGRGSDEQPILPDVDLSPYRAYEYGISRLHAVLRRLKDRVVIVDLGSSNGTFLKGDRLEAYIEHPLSHGDIISLAKLKIQVILNTNERR